MKKVLLSLGWLWPLSLQAIPLSEFLSVPSVGQEIAGWRTSKLIPENMVGKTFQLPSAPGKTWQIRFFTFEDQDAVLLSEDRFTDFVKAYDLGALESNKDAIPYSQDGTSHSFTYKDANAFLEENGKAPLPEGVIFIISLRDVTDALR